MACTNMPLARERPAAIEADAKETRASQSGTNLVETGSETEVRRLGLQWGV